MKFFGVAMFALLAIAAAQDTTTTEEPPQDIVLNGQLDGTSAKGGKKGASNSLSGDNKLPDIIADFGDTVLGVGTGKKGAKKQKTKKSGKSGKISSGSPFSAGSASSVATIAGAGVLVAGVALVAVRRHSRNMGYAMKADADEATEKTPLVEQTAIEV